MLIRLLKSRLYWLAPLLFWLAIISLSLIWNLRQLDGIVRDMALERGRSLFQMVRQTKIDPLLMQNDPEIFKRQVVQDIGYRVVSTRPKNPANRADPWEARALDGFTRAGEYRFEQDQRPGEPRFRFIGPIFAEQVCLSCHGGEGLQVGDLRGGISVSVDALPLYAAQAANRRWLLLTHIAGFLLLAGSTTFLMRSLRHHWRLLNESRERERRQEAFLDSITRTMGEGCVVVDARGEVIFANPESEWILGWEAEQMVGKRWLDLISRLPPEARDDPASSLHQTLCDGLSRREENESFQHRDGMRIPVAFAISPLMEGEMIEGAVITFNDTSERQRGEEERRSLERQLNQQHKMEAVGQLAGGIAHEINTPIQYIGENLRFLTEAYEDLLRMLDAYQTLMQQAETEGVLRPLVQRARAIAEEVESDYLKEEIPKTLEQSMAGTDQIVGIVQAMKEFAHPGTRQMAPADLNRIIRNAVAVCKNEWKYVAETELRLDPGLPEVHCNGGEISQVVLNLVVNAAHAIEMAQREGKGRITISSALRGGQAEVRVSDTGGGIPEAIRNSVFNPFFTTKEAGRGSGQGLAIAQDIVVVKHRGRLYFETEMDRGTTFIMRLPLTPEPAV